MYLENIKNLKKNLSNFELQYNKKKFKKNYY